MSKKVAVMQPYFFPYIGYFQLINSANVFVNFDDVNFIKKGWISRNYILNKDKPFLFSIPLEKPSQNRLIRDLSINNVSDWKIKFLKTVSHFYKNAVCFNDVYKVIDDVINFESNNLSEFVLNSIKKIAGFLNIKVKFIDSSSKYNNSDLKRENRIIDICKKEKAGEYINPIGGVALYSKSDFESCGIKLSFLKSGKIRYKQFNDNFIDNLSIIDILMFNPKERVSELLNNYKII
ncbi:MAG: hypothetical protein HGGPFJEG_00942 [Ignavibacteria bacterium]|nr:hypothetical protein [Ignavibacteria bacterium]